MMRGSGMLGPQYVSETVVSVILLLRFLMSSLSVCVCVFLLTVVCYAQFVVLDKVETATERIREVAGIVWTFNSWGGMLDNFKFTIQFRCLRFLWCMIFRG